MDRYEHDRISDRLIGAPKSVRIAETIEAEIRSGRLGNGAPLESESGLVKRFSVSRNTVRKSLEILNRKGLITTRTGIGSFVTFDGKTIDDRGGWTLALSVGGVGLATRVLNLRRGSMDLENAPEGIGDDFLVVDRLRFKLQTGLGVSLERSRITWRDGFEDILSQGLTGGSLTATLRDKRIAVTCGDEWANVLPALSQQDAQLMGRTAGEPMLRVSRLTRAADRSIIEYVESTLDPTLFGLHMEF